MYWVGVTDIDSRVDCVTKFQGLEDKSDLITSPTPGPCFLGVDGRIFMVQDLACWGRCLFYIYKL
jgi:hypothetical protein